MFLHTTHVQPLPGYRLRLAFNNGIEGEVCLQGELWGEMFEPLKEESVFMSAQHDEASGTVVWSNSADLAPEFLLELLQKQTQQAA
jgi:hypothetical protein